MYTWWRTLNCLCFLDTDVCRTEVCTSGEKALALIFGVQHFHQYLYECQFTLITDHMSLTTILGPHHAIPTLAAARLQRWAITLSTDNYKIQFQSMKEHPNTDGLLCLPLNSPLGEEASRDAACYNLDQIQALPVTVAKCTVVQGTTLRSWYEVETSQITFEKFSTTCSDHIRGSYMAIHC